MLVFPKYAKTYAGTIDKGLIPGATRSNQEHLSGAWVTGYYFPGIYGRFVSLFLLVVDGEMSFSVPPFNQIHSWNFRERNYFRRHNNIQRGYISNWLYPGHQDPLQADRNLPIHAFHLLPPSGFKTRFYQRRSNKTPKNKLFTNYFWRVPLKLQTAPQSARIS